MSKNVEALAALLQQPVETVKTALEAEGGLVDRITAFRKDFTVLNASDRDKLVSNAKEQGKEEFLADFKPESLSKKDINRTVAWKLQEIEDELKERYGFDGDFRGTLDLVDKIIKTKSGNKDNSPEKDTEIAKLKQKITDLTAEKEEALDKVRKETDEFVIKTEFERGLSRLDLDYESDAIDKQRKLLTDSFNGSYRVVRKDGKVFVYEQGKDEPLMDDKRDPLPIDAVINRHAQEYGFKIKSPGKGGQGGSSSQQPANSYAGITQEAFMQDLQAKGIKWSSPEGEKMYREWRAANKQ